MIPVLFLAFEFPPVSTTGVHRSAKFAKYLRESGIDPIVLTLDEADAREAFRAPLEQSLLEDLPADLAVYRFAAPAARPAPASPLGSFLTVFGRTQDPFADSVRPSLSRGLPEIVARHKPQAIYVSLPPFSAGGLASAIARELALPLVVDMRDGWSHWCTNPFPSYAHWLLTLLKERHLFASAAAVVTVTEQLADVFRASHPGLPHNHFHVIPNGFDGPLDLPDAIGVPARIDEQPFTVGYVGNYYYSPQARQAALTPWWRRSGHRKVQYQPVREDWLYRSPFFFLRALAELRRRDPALGGRVRFAHVGRKPDWLEAMVAEHGLVDAVHYLGVVPHAEVLPLARTFDAQLCTSVKVEGGKDYALASKTFDYIQTQRPILGLVTEGAQAEFLRSSGMALVVDPDDLAGGVDALARLVQGGFALRPQQAFLEGFQRRALSARMAQVIRGAVERAPVSRRYERSSQARSAPDS